MKAGIYRTQQGSLVYVRKDRSIGGFLYASGTFNSVNLEFKAVTSCKEQFIRFPELFDGLAERWADVPNGCTDPEKALRDAKEANAAEIKDALGLPTDLKTGESVADWAQRKVEQKIVENCAQALGVDPYKEFASGGVVSGRYEGGLLSSNLASVERRFVGVPPALAAPYGETDLVEWRRKFAASLRSQGFRICHTRSARKHKKQGHTVIPLHGGWYAWRPADYMHPYQREGLARMREASITVPINAGKSGAHVLKAGAP